MAPGSAEEARPLLEDQRFSLSCRVAGPIEPWTTGVLVSHIGQVVEYMNADPVLPAKVFSEEAARPVLEAEGISFVWLATGLFSFLVGKGFLSFGRSGKANVGGPEGLRSMSVRQDPTEFGNMWEDANTWTAGSWRGL